MFAAEPLQPAYRQASPGVACGETAPLDWIAFAGGILAVGHDGDGFAFDNEGPRHEALIRPFKLANRLRHQCRMDRVHRRRRLPHAELWLADGWDTVSAQDWTAPLYWEDADGGVACR